MTINLSYYDNETILLQRNKSVHENFWKLKFYLELPQDVTEAHRGVLIVSQEEKTCLK